MSEAPVTPLDLPVEAGGTLVLFGGTFDPPHRAHLELPLVARTLIAEKLGGEAWLVFVPAARSPHKQRGPEASDADRVAMLRIALEWAEGGRAPGAERALIWTDEIDRAEWERERAGEAGPSYMIDTVRRAAEAAPGWRVALLIGADQAPPFHRWREARRILELAEVFVLPRAEVGTGAAVAQRLRETGAWSEAELERWRDAVLPTPLLDVAATPVRGWLREPDQHEVELRRALGERVLEYIRERGLYAS